MFMAALFVIAKKWKQPKCPSTDKWINKMWYMHITKLLFSHKKEWSTDTCLHKNAPWKYYTKWKKLATKDKCYSFYILIILFHLNGILEIKKSIELESILVVAR